MSEEEATTGAGLVAFVDVEEVEAGHLRQRHPASMLLRNRISKTVRSKINSSLSL